MSQVIIARNKNQCYIIFAQLRVRDETTSTRRPDAADARTSQDKSAVLYRAQVANDQRTTCPLFIVANYYAPTQTLSTTARRRRTAQKPNVQSTWQLKKLIVSSWSA